MRYDVFLSFRGEEIRRTFLSHLLHSLDRKGIRSVTSAPSYPPKWLVAITVISKNCTSLDFWVEEVARIIACEKKAVPIFLRVDPVDVLRELNLAEDINEPRRNTLEKVKNWLDGHVTSNSGFNSSDWEDDSQLVDQITCFVSHTVKQDSILLDRWCPRLDWLKSPWHYTSFGKGKTSLPYHAFLPSLSDVEITGGFLSRIKRSETVIESSSDLHSSKPSETILESPWWDKFIKKMNPVAEQHSTINETSCCDLRGMKHRVEDVLSMLQSGDSTKEFRTIGIYGMDGVGKTTLAKYVYEEISPQFQHHFFITNFSKKGSTLLEILASGTLNTTTNFNGDSEIIKEMVGRKVLLVADSVDDMKQLKGFAKEISLFGPGSRVIVITQDRSLLFQCGVKDIYEVGCPGYHEAIQLFSQFAFMQTTPVSGFERFSVRAVEAAARIPLALKVLGSYLYGRNQDEWESTLRRLEASHTNYNTAEVLRYIGADDSATTSPTILELGENEANRFPLYSFTL